MKGEIRMLDLNKIVKEAMEKIAGENFVMDIVEKRLKKTIEDVIEDTFRSYSDFGKNLKAHVDEKLKVDLHSLNIEGYNGLVLATVKEQLDTIISIQGIDRIKQSLDEMLKDVKSEYKLSEILEKFRESEFDEDEMDCQEYFTLVIEPASCGFTHIYFDKESNKRKYGCQFGIDIDKDGRAYSVKLRDKVIDTKKILGGLYGLEALLFKIYSSGAKVLLDQGNDVDNYNTYIGESD
jgi:hypothetical protein